MRIKKKTNVLILGATGFIGRNIVERFAKKNNFNVYCTYYKSKPPKKFKYLKIKILKIDLTNKINVNKILKNKDIVIQAAAVTTGINDVVNKPYIHVTDNAVMNSLILRSAFENKIKHLIFFSCTTMYPNVAYPVKENDFNHNIVEKYFGVGWTKVYIEKMCNFYSKISKTKFTVIRHSNIYGPYDKYDLIRSHVFGATVTKVMYSKENKFTVWGDGKEKRDLLYVSDLVDFVDIIIKKQTKNFELINIGLGKTISVKDLVRKIINLSNKKLEILYDTSKPTIKFNLALNIKYAKKNYGWAPKISLNQGIEKTLKWYKKNIIKDKKNNIIQKD